MLRYAVRHTATLLFAALICAPALRLLAQSPAPAPPEAAPSALPNPQADPDNPLHTASRTELDVVKVLLAQERAWNLGDLDGFLHEFKQSPDTAVVGHDVTRGYQQIVTDYRRNYTTRSSMGTLTYSELEVTRLGDTFAACTGRYHLDRSKKDGGSADGLFSTVLEKTASGWKIVLTHTT